MGSLVIVAVDGSEPSLSAAHAGIELVGRDRPLLVVTVVRGPDSTDLTGVSGMAGPSMTEEEFDAESAAVSERGSTIVHEARAALGIDDAPVRVLDGDPGTMLCLLADELDAGAIILGTRGHGGLRRALIGSVSDYVVRNARCPVVVVGPHGDHEHDAS